MCKTCDARQPALDSLNALASLDDFPGPIFLDEVKALVRIAFAQPASRRAVERLHARLGEWLSESVPSVRTPRWIFVNGVPTDTHP
jgi:hypothetical protein